MKVLITGPRGQLGYELLRTAPPDVDAIGLDRTRLDITDAAQVMDCVGALRPDWIVNAAAYSLVDKAETERDLARVVNADAPANLARAADMFGARLLHVSTDFVFDGRKSSPYLPDDVANPLSVYGQTKLDGERAILETLGQRALIIRTAWLHCRHGRNFVKTMLGLMREREVVRVVADQVGTPTWAAELARVLYAAMACDVRGTHHWTNAGVASWYDFAVAVQELGCELGLLRRPASIEPIPTSAYPTPAHRPHYSVLNKESLRAALGYRGAYWRDALRNMIQELIDG